MRRLILLNLFIAVLFSSCLSRKHLAYFQDKNDEYPPKPLETNIEVQKFEPIINSNDILSIYVTSLSPEASSFFNNNIGKQSEDIGSGSSLPAAVGYLVDVNGNIEMPLIGQVKVSGLTTSKATETIRLKLEKFLLNPSVRLYFENFRVTILGEVTRPGVYQVPNEKLTLPEALGLSGDLTVFGRRSNILVIRETGGKKTFERLNLLDKSILSSPYYYLHPNDVIYVEPNKGRATQADAFFRIAPIVVSTLTLIAVIYNTATR